MISLSQITVVPVISECERQEALQVLRATYEREKRWVADGNQVFSPDDLDRFDVAWFLARRNREPVGVLRVLFNPPLEVYARYGFQPVPGTNFDVTEFVKRSRVAEIGRFAVLPERRKNHFIAASLMRAAARILLAGTFLTIEPFALAMRRGDGDFRLAVDTALSHVYRSGEIATIFTKTFGAGEKPTPTLQALYMIATLPE